MRVFDLHGNLLDAFLSYGEFTVPLSVKYAAGIYWVETEFVSGELKRLKLVIH